jgi:integrase
MSVRRIPFTDKKSGEKRLSEKFYAVFQDQAQIQRRLPGFADRKATVEVERKVRNLVELRAAGETLPPELARFIETMPPTMRERLAEWGVLDKTRVAAGKPLTQHIEDWRQALLAKANGREYIDLVAARAQAVFDGSGFKFWSDLCAEKVQAHLSELREPKLEKKGIGPQTSNFYLQAVKQFCKWMVRARRATESPVAHLQGLNVKADRRHDRRAFSVDELLWVLKTTESGPERSFMSGKERALLYRLAVETGLRRGGLARLTRQSFELDGVDSTILVKAGAKNKYKSDRRVPLRAETARLLREFLEKKMPEALAFKVPSHKHSAKMIRADLDAARAAWLDTAETPKLREEREQSDFLRYKNAGGEYLDFHALRHTRGVWLFEHHKAHPREVQELMGVSSLALVDRYTRSFRITDLSLIERGPDLSKRPDDISGAQAATGIDGETGICLPASLRLKGEVQRISADLHGVSKSEDERTKQIDNELQTPHLQREEKRRGGDSNSRYPFGQTGFRNRRIQPLCHLSGTFNIRWKNHPLNWFFRATGKMISHAASLHQTPALVPFPLNEFRAA